jgi:hypothetical protein
MSYQISYNAAMKRDGCTEEVVFVACLCKVQGSKMFMCDAGVQGEMRIL